MRARMLHSRYTVVTLLLHCCHTAVTLLSHCCYTVVTLLLPGDCTVPCVLGCWAARNQMKSGPPHPAPGAPPAITVWWNKIRNDFLRQNLVNPVSFAVGILLLHCCYNVVTLLARLILLLVGHLTQECYTVVTLLSHCCRTVVTLLSHCCHTVVTLLLHCCYTVLTLYLYGCYTVVILLLYCCYTVVTLAGSILLWCATCHHSVTIGWQHIQSSVKAVGEQCNNSVTSG
jgi:hypothetical protein